MKKNITILLALIGIGLFVNLIIRIGVKTILDTITNISPGYFLVLLMIRFVFWYIRSLNWKIIMERCDIRLPFRKIFGARIAGFAVNYLTPSANIGGEAARIMLINNKSKKNALASVILDKTIELVATIFFVVGAVAVAIYKIPMPPAQKYIYGGVVLFSVAGMIFILRKQRQGLLKWIIGKLEKFRISFQFIRNNMDKIREIDKNISGFYRHNRRSFYTVLFFYFIYLLVWTSEIYFTLQFLGMTEITFLKSFLIVSLGSVSFFMPVLPGGVGVYELTYLAIFKLLGLSTTFCMALVITRRVIALIWAGIGLIFLTQSGTSDPDTGIGDKPDITSIEGI